MHLKPLNWAQRIKNNAAHLALVSALTVAFSPMTQAQDTPLKVFVSIAPHQYMAEQIAGDLAQVTALVPAGQDPHLFEPTPRQVASLEQANIYFKTGMEFEDGWLSRINDVNPGMHVVDLREGVKIRTIESAIADWDDVHEHDEHDHEGHHDDHDHEEHHHDHEAHHDDHDHKEHHHDHEAHHDDHDHKEHHHDHEAHHNDHDHEEHHHEHHHHAGLPDPHIWMNPRFAIQQATNIHDSLVQLDPEHRKAYDHGLAQLKQKFEQADQALSQQLAPLSGHPVLVFHPSWGYLTDRYNLKQWPIEMGGHEPTPRQLAELTDKAQDANVQLILVQPQMSQATAKRVAEQLGAQVVQVDPLAYDLPGTWAQVGQALSQKAQR